MMKPDLAKLIRYPNFNAFSGLFLHLNDKGYWEAFLADGWGDHSNLRVSLRAIEMTPEAAVQSLLEKMDEAETV
jgi:hypothetical protein